MTRTLGIANYGLYALVMSIMSYFTLIVGYGFRLTATDKISKNIESKSTLNTIFWNTIWTKTFLLIFCFFALCLAGLLIASIKAKMLLLFAGFLVIIGNVMIPDFYFLGTQKMKYITIATTIGKIIMAILIFTLVKSKEDVLAALLCNGIGTLIIGLIALRFALKSLPFKIEMPSFDNIKQELKEGLYVFFSQISVSFYSTINVILLGAFTNTTLVGYYSITEKIYKSLSALVSTPINLALYPKLSKLYITSKIQFKLRVKQIMGLLLIVFILLAIFLFFFASPIVNFLVKDQSPEEIEMLIKLVKIVSIALIFNPFGAFFTQQFIIKDRRKRLLQNILILGLINIILVMFFIPNIVLVVWAIVINRILGAFLNGYFALKD